MPMRSLAGTCWSCVTSNTTGRKDGSSWLSNPASFPPAGEEPPGQGHPLWLVAEPDTTHAGRHSLTATFRAIICRKDEATCQACMCQQARNAVANGLLLFQVRVRRFVPLKLQLDRLTDVGGNR